MVNVVKGYEYLPEVLNGIDQAVARELLSYYKYVIRCGKYSCGKIYGLDIVGSLLKQMIINKENRCPICMQVRQGRKSYFGRTFND